MNSMDQTSNFFIIMEKHKQSKGDIDSDKIKKQEKVKMKMMKISESDKGKIIKTYYLSK